MDNWEVWEREVIELLGLDSTITSGSKWYDPGDATTRGRDDPFPLFADAKFCLDEDTEILTRRGWLRHTQVEVGDQTLGLSENGTVGWTPIMEVHAFPGHHEMVAWKMRGHDSLSTHNHRWLVERQRGKIPTMRWTVTNNLGDRILDAVVCARELTEYPEPKYSDALVELVGWYWTEGCRHRKAGISIAQDPIVNPDNWASIRSALISCFGQYTAHGDGRAFYVGSKRGQAESIWTHAPGRDKVLSMDFILSLTKAQLYLFINTSIKADGHARGRRRVIHQRSRTSLDVFQVACQLVGIRSVMRVQADGMWRLELYERSLIYPSSSRRRSQFVSTHYHGTVWCPTTSTGTWLARRSGTAYFTGNTEKASFSLKAKELRQWSNRAAEAGKRFILPLRFKSPGQRHPEDYVVMSFHDFVELRDGLINVLRG